MNLLLLIISHPIHQQFNAIIVTSSRAINSSNFTLFTMQPQRRIHTAINPHADHNNNNNNNNEHAHREVLHQAPPAHPHPHPPPTAALPQTLPDAPDATAAFMMKRFAKQTIEKGVAGLMEEFDTLQKRLQKNIPEHKYFDHNMDKNRYKDIYCIDSTRVKLTWPPGSKDDYIHANWIRGFPELTKSIIATQAPKEQSIGDFWRMVWQEKVAVIVMLCQLIENNKQKADLYWPYDQHQSFENSGLKITNNGVDDEPDKQMRTTRIIVRGRSSRTGEIREHIVVHVMWSGWPDKDVPTSSTKAIQLIHRVNAGRSSNDVVVVHCSAGIGRTGTIIALEVGIRKLMAANELSIWNVVRTLREQRYNACQTPGQYVYIHYALLSYMVCKGVIDETTVKQLVNDYQTQIVNKKKKNE